MIKPLQFHVIVSYVYLAESPPKKKRRTEGPDDEFLSPYPRTNDVEGNLIEWSRTDEVLAKTKEFFVFPLFFKQKCYIRGVLWVSDNLINSLIRLSLIC